MRFSLSNCIWPANIGDFWKLDALPAAAHRLGERNAGKTTRECAAHLGIFRRVEIALAVEHGEISDLPVAGTLLRFIERSLTGRNFGAQLSAAVEALRSIQASTRD